MYINDQQINTGSFNQQTPLFDIARLKEVAVNTEEFKQLLVQLAQQVNNVSISLNNKISGYYQLTEFVSGKQYFASSTPTVNDAILQRNTFLKVINFGALPNTATKTVAHNLTPDTAWTFTNIYGAATDPTALSYIPIPYVSSTAKASDIEVYVDNTNVTIVTGSDYSSYTRCYIVLEYLKN